MEFVFEAMESNRGQVKIRNEITNADYMETNSVNCEGGEGGMLRTLVSSSTSPTLVLFKF